MKAVCDTCGARYRIPDEKAAGKVLQIRCRKCGNIFKFEGKTAPSRPKSPKGDWFFAIDGESFGPYTERELRTRFEAGKLGLNTHVWKEGFSDWLPVVEHPEFAAAVELSKDNIRRLGSKSPESSRTTDGSGRFTVDIRRPGATVDQRTQEQRDALNDEVDDAFKSLLGQSASHNEPSDEFTPTKPMRLSTTRTSSAETTPADEPGETLEATRPVSEKRPEPSKPSRPSTSEETVPASKQPAAEPSDSSAKPVAEASKPPTRPAADTPAKPTAKGPPKRLSLSERLRLIREQSESTDTKKPSAPSEQSDLPTRDVQRPSATTGKPEAVPSLDAAADGDLFSGGDIPRDAGDTPLPSDLPAADIPASQDLAPKGPVAPIPAGPIRQVTQDIDVSDFFGPDATGDFPAQRDAAAPVDVPSDEDLQAHLSKRKEARARGEKPPSPASTDDPPFVLPGDLPPKSTQISKTGASSPYRLDGTADSYDDAPPYILDEPAKPAAKDTRITEHDITPVGGTAAVKPSVQTSSHASVKAPERRRRSLLILIVLLSLLLLALIAGWVILRSDGDLSEALSTVEDALETDTPALADPTDIMYARNRALGIVAQSRSAAQTAAFVATEDERNAEQQRRLRPTSNNTRSAGSSNNRAPNTPIEFTTASSAGGRLGAQRSAANTGPSKALFADVLRSTVGRSVGRCAQRTLGVQGYLPVSRLELSITINPDGTVSRVRGQREAHGGPLMKCITNESQRWKFPSFSGKATTISNAYIL